MDIIQLDSSPEPSTSKTAEDKPKRKRVLTPDNADDEPQAVIADTADDKPKRKRRTKEEIEQEKMEKEIKKIRRDMNAAKNAKCEQFLFCYVDRSVCLLDDDIEQELRNRFTERAVPDQIAFVDNLYGVGRIIWKRKRIDAVIEDGKASAFTHLIKTNGFQEFVEKVSKEHCHPRSMPNIVVFGQGGPHTTVTTTLSLKAFEHHRNQVRYCKNAIELSFLVAQLHRAIAKSEKRLARDDDAPIVDVEKGIREGIKTDLRLDWWTRMLSHVHRLSEEQKRAIVNRWPDPFVLMDKLLELEPDAAIKTIADVVAGNNRRIGPAIAKIVYTFLTSKDGEDVIVD